MHYTGVPSVPCFLQGLGDHSGFLPAVLPVTSSSTSTC